jgi:hypothetical protein
MITHVPFNQHKSFTTHQEAWTYFIAYYPHIKSPDKATFMNENCPREASNLMNPSQQFQEIQGLNFIQPGRDVKEFFQYNHLPTHIKEKCYAASLCMQAQGCSPIKGYTFIPSSDPPSTTTNTTFNANAHPSPLPTNPHPPPYFTNLPICQDYDVPPNLSPPRTYTTIRPATKPNSNPYHPLPQHQVDDASMRSLTDTSTIVPNPQLTHPPTTVQHTNINPGDMSIQTSTYSHYPLGKSNADNVDLNIFSQTSAILLQRLTNCLDVTAPSCKQATTIEQTTHTSYSMSSFPGPLQPFSINFYPLSPQHQSWKTPYHTEFTLRDSIQFTTRTKSKQYSWSSTACLPTK